MAIPKIKEQDIIDALRYIDENGVPFHIQSTKYALVTEDGQKYPPKYVIAVATHIASGADILTDGFNAVEAKNYLQGQGFSIETKQERFELTISAESIVSTDERFTMDNLSLGDNYSRLVHASEKRMARRLSVPTVRVKGEILSRRFHVSPARFSRNSLRPCQLRTKRAFLSANIIRPMICCGIYSRWMISRSIATQ